ncbi:MAG: PAS domain S-box protein [Nitrospirae bacterium]|nr:PAS domain S-box protein [Nitrospirota bacterium]
MNNESAPERITENAARTLLRRSEERFRVIFESSAMGIVITDLDGRPVHANRAFQEMIGYTEDELASMKFSEFTHPDDLPANLELFHDLATGRRDYYRMEKRYVHKSGRHFWSDLTVSLVRNDAGAPLFAVAMVLDIQERKTMEREIQRRRNLESLGILAGGIAHDFNNLLTTIFGSIEIARLHLNPASKAYELLGNAEHAFTRAQELSRQLLTFSRGGEPVKREESLRDLLGNSCDFSLSGSTIRCDIDIPADLWPVEFDRAQIGQVVHNLLLNARDAMPAGGVITLSASNVELASSDSLPVAPGCYIKISIADQGMGIARENLPKIFDPYFTTKQMGARKGTGLGLAICFSIIKKHDGHITVESEVGRGTVFHIYLPAISGVRGASVAVEDEQPAGIRVLVMDDEELLLQVAMNMLQACGYETVGASSGEDAVLKYRTAVEAGRRPDVVILDLTVRGGMGGVEALRHLLEIDPDVKAVVSSGYADDPILASYYNYGFLASLPKPYKVAEIDRVLQAVMASR